MSMQIKKISKTAKLTIVIILLTVVLVGIVLAILSNTTILYCMKIEQPSRIVVYKNNASINKVFESNTNEYNLIYNEVINSYKESTLQAIFSGRIFKDIDIVKVKNTNIDFDGFNINFIYDTPQVVKTKNGTYKYDNTNYWYTSLMFNITDTSSWQLNKVYIIPTEESDEFVSYYTCNLYYNIYSNYEKLYPLLTTII